MIDSIYAAMKLRELQVQRGGGAAQGSVLVPGDFARELIELLRYHGYDEVADEFAQEMAHDAGAPATLISAALVQRVIDCLNRIPSSPP